jgi:hypothetical protein
MHTINNLYVKKVNSAVLLKNMNTVNALLEANDQDENYPILMTECPILVNGQLIFMCDVCSIADFEVLCAENNININEGHILSKYNDDQYEEAEKGEIDYWLWSEFECFMLF